jgi:hypothetical protein
MIKKLLFVALFLLPFQAGCVHHFSGNYEHQFGGKVERGDFSLMSHNRLRLDLGVEPHEDISFRANFIAQTFHGKTRFCITEFMPKKFHPIARALPEHLRTFKLEDKYVLDNAFVTFCSPPLMVRAGKQQIPWGTGYVWNPTNIFHPISILDPVAEPPGVEALRLDRVIEDANVSFILAPEGYRGEADLALRINKHLEGFDLSVSTVNRQREDRWLYGGDFAGELLGFGVLGEVAYNRLPHDSYIQAVIGANYTTELQTHIMVEFHHNGAGRKTHHHYTFEDWMQLISGKRTNLARDYLFLRVSHPVMEHLMEVECSTIINLNDKSFIVIPKLTHNLAENVVITAMFNVFEGRQGTEYGQFPSGMFVQAKVYF